MNEQMDLNYRVSFSNITNSNAKICTLDFNGKLYTSVFSPDILISDMIGLERLINIIEIISLYKLPNYSVKILHREKNLIMIINYDCDFINWTEQILFTPKNSNSSANSNSIANLNPIANSNPIANLNPIANPKQIFIKTLQGKSMTIQVYDSDTIGNIKQMIQYKEGIPLEQQRLVLNGKTLENNKTVKDYAIKKMQIFIWF